jgi:hypothetical protein
VPSGEISGLERCIEPLALLLGGCGGHMKMS